LPADEADHERLLEELGRMNSELAAQRRLSAMTVHDLANPAQVITGLSELLLEYDGLDPMVRARIEQLHRSAQTMTALIADLSQGYELDDYSRVDVARIDLVALVTSVVERTRVLAKSKDMDLVLMVEQPDRRGCWVDGDPIKLERALSNLLGNAIKFSPLGSSVSVALDRGTTHATVAVHDSGPGINEDGMEKIFEVYHREPDADNLPGRGLGLFITRQIAQSHGGSVSVESEPGRGATFLLRVPLAVDVALAHLG